MLKDRYNAEMGIEPRTICLQISRTHIVVLECMGNELLREDELKKAFKKNHNRKQIYPQ